MSLSGDLAAGRTESPDPASHATNIYDQEEEWRDEEENDDLILRQIKLRSSPSLTSYIEDENEDLYQDYLE